MSFYSKESKVFGYIVYSRYGRMSHIVMNEHGVVFAVNPIFEDKKAKIFTKEEAEQSRDTFYNCISAVVLVAEYEMDAFVYEEKAAAK